MQVKLGSYQGESGCGDLQSLSSAIETLRMRIADLRGRGIYSEYADAYGFIFIHIPKTGGSSIVQALLKSDSRHIPVSEYLRANPQKFRRYFKFSFVRNPFDRLVSSFHFLKSGGMNPQDSAWAKENLSSIPDFPSFVNEWLSVESADNWIHFMPQYQFLCDHTGALRVDFVGRFESLETDFELVGERLGVDAGLPWKNKGDHKLYGDYYDASMKEKVADIYQRDFELFGYDLRS
jgi:chondroitin 4-sulfotransferase 11